MLASRKFNRMEKIVNLIKDLKMGIINKTENFTVDGKSTRIKVPFLSMICKNQIRKK